MTIKVQLDTTRLDALTKQAQARAETAVRDTAFQVQVTAQALVPVNTGALRDSLVAEQRGPLIWVVHDGVDYGVAVELGSARVRARPFLTPAVESQRAAFISRLTRILE